MSDDYDRGTADANRHTLNVHGAATPPDDWGTLGPGHLWFAPADASGDTPDGWIYLGEVTAPWHPAGG